MSIVDLPDVLQYGLTGLAAVIVLMTYRLLINQSKKEKPNQSLLKTIKAFMGFGIILSVISGVGNIAELFANTDHLKGQHQLNTELVEAKAEIERLKGDSQDQEVVQELETQIASLKLQLVGAQESMKVFEGKSTSESRVLDRLVADSIESHWRYTRAKTRRVSESNRTALRCILVKRAAFIDLRKFEANDTILKNALIHLTNRGYTDMSPCVESVVNDLDSIKILKLRWLEDKAIPALQDDIRNLGVAQRGPSANVRLPDILAIPKELGGFEPPEITVTNMSKLQEEATFIKAIL